ncbi:MAG: hypothetical protein AAGK04_04385 [Planctomycetota bacterium]
MSTLRSLLVSVVAVMLASPAAAQSESSSASAFDQRPARPSTAHRVVRTFDFDHPDLNPGDVPIGWVRAQDADGVRDRPGFPLWNLARLDTQHAQSPPGSILLDISGQSASLRLLPGVIPVFPGADYLIVAKVRTEDLEDARARLVARFLDATGEPIAESETSSPLVRSPGRWSTLRLALVGAYENAADIQIDLELVQPSVYAPRSLDPHRIRAEDIDARVWFDDVVVSQLPRVELSTAAPANITTADEPPTIELSVRDLTGETLDAELHVTDDTGRHVDAWHGRLGRGNIRESWTPQLPGFGWYRADLIVSNEQGPIGSASLDFVHIPARPETPTDAAGDRRRFMLMLGDRADHLIDAAPEMLDRVGIAALAVPLWRDDDDPERILAALERLAPVAESLARRAVDLDFELPLIPHALRRDLALEAGDIPALLARDRSTWSPYLDPFLDRFGQLSARWRLGAAEPLGGAPIAVTGLGERIATARDALARLVPGPRVRIPWPSEIALPPEFASIESTSVAIHLPSDLDADAIAPLVATLADSGLRASDENGPSIDMVLAPPDLDDTAPRDAAVAFTRLTLAFWRSLATGRQAEHRRLAIAAPWTPTLARRPQIMPRPELAALANLSDRLNGRVFTTAFSPAPHVTAWLFEPRPNAPLGHDALLVVWADHPTAKGVPVEFQLAARDVHAFDIYANQTTLPLTTVGLNDRTIHRFTPTDEPLFIEGVDPRIMRFAAGVRIRPTFFTVSQGAIRTELVVENPFEEPLAGQWTIVSPGGRAVGAARSRSWDIRPAAGSLSIAAGGSRTIQLSVAFSLLEHARKMPFIIEAELPTGRVRVHVPVEIGVPDVDVELSYRPAPGPDGPHLVVRARIANFRETDLSLRGAAFAPGAPRQNAILPTLPSQRQTTRRFFFRDAYEASKGKDVVVSFTTANDERLSKSIYIDP